MIKSVRCVTFYVSDLQKAVRFYTEVLELDKMYEFSSYVGFQCGNVEIGLIPKPETRQTTRTSSSSVEFLVDNVDRVYDELKSGGVKFTEELHDEPWGGRQVAFADPDGNVLEIVQIDWEKYFDVSARGAKKKP